jgi:hypothetical protein
MVRFRLTLDFEAPRTRAGRATARAMVTFMERKLGTDAELPTLEVLDENGDVVDKVAL